MPTWIALLRGINVGGKNILPMKSLVKTLESLRLTGVRTYIQSGNVVFASTDRSAANLEKKIAAAIADAHGVSPHVLVRSAEQLREAISANPFPEGEAEPKTLHLAFLAAAAKKPDLAAMTKLKAPDESFELHRDVFYLHAPSGIGRSRLAARIEQHLGVPVTGRNWRTVTKLLEMAAG